MKKNGNHYMVIITIYGQKMAFLLWPDVTYVLYLLIVNTPILIMLLMCDDKF